MAGVLVVGSLHMDIVLDAPHLPQLDETVTGHAVRYVCGGKGGNQAVAAARCGARVAMAGRVGDDGFGKRLRANLFSSGVDASNVEVSTGEASGMSVAIVNDNGGYGAVIVSAANLGIDAGRIAWPGGTGLLLLQSEVPEAVNLTAARLARRHGAKVILNAAPARELHPDLLAETDILLVNRIEAAALAGPEVDDPASALAVAGILARLAPTVIVTLGGEGLVLAERGAVASAVAAFAVSAVSSHGAGDMFAGALAAHLAVGHPLGEAILYAQAAAALYVSTLVDARDRIGREAIASFAETCFRGSAHPDVPSPQP